MAKRKADQPAGETLPANLRRLVFDLRRPIMQAAQKFGVIRESLKELAPRVMRAFAALQAHDAAISFVQFARMIDPTIPTAAADRDGATGYRNHKTYYTLQYMRRLVQLRPRGRQGVRDSATDALARTIATMLQFVADPESVWKAVQAEFGFSERVITGLRRRVGQTKPLFVAKPQRPVPVGKVIHMERTTAQAAAADVEADVNAPRRKAG
jgi:hypothetical protein